MDQLFTQIGDILGTVFDPNNPLAFMKPEVWQEVLSRPEVVVAAFVVLNLIVFTETGLLVGFFLPGDSLLVTAGVVAQLSGWNVPLLIGTLCASAVIGDTIGYWIGAKGGDAIFNRPNSRFFKRDHLLAAKAFYDKHGGKTIILARFMPFIRTFAPVVAGAAKMEYRTFLLYNVVGGVAWVVSMILFGYYLIPVLDPLLKPVFGPQFTMAKQIDKVALAVIAVSVAPIFWKAYKGWRASRSAKAAALEAVAAVPAGKTPTTMV
jgi:membrane-associated protein